MTDNTPDALYPRYCFHLSPTFNNWCLLRVSDIHGLTQPIGFEGEKFYFFKNLPIKWVRIVGVVVAVDEFAGRRVFTVDDSSGACIEATVDVPDNTNTIDISGTTSNSGKDPKAAPTSNEIIDVGTVVDLKGQLDTFRDQRQIKIQKAACLRCTAQEIVLWGKRDKFRREVLDKPWILRSKDVHRCRKEAERSEEEEQRKKKRVKTLTEGGASRHAFQFRPDPPTDVKPSIRLSNHKRVVHGATTNGKRVHI